jgi:hypothetical protein
MKARIINLLSIALLMVGTGCATPRNSVPQSEISGSLNGKPVRVLLPKDMKAAEIKFGVTTNGTVELSIKNIETRMNPDVITMTGEAYSKMRAADAAAFSTAAESAGKVGGAAASAFVAPH